MRYSPIRFILSRTVRCRPLPVRAAPAALAAALLAAGPAVVPAIAQDAGGRQLSIDLSQRLEAVQNRRLTAGGDDGALISTTALGFGLSSATPTDRLTAQLSTALRGAAGEATDEFDISDPQLAFGYARAGADADLGLDLRLSRAEIAYLRPLEVIVNDDGTIEVPTDLDELTGTGTRTTRALSARLDWGKQARVGLGARIGVTDRLYDDVTGSELEDSRRLSASLSARYDITPVLQAITALSYGRTEEDGARTRETRGFSAGLSARAASGTLSASFGATRPGGDDTRLSLGGGWTRDLAGGGSLSLRLGATRPGGGGTALTADATWLRPLPTGQISLQLRRGVQDDTDGAEVLTTGARAGWSHRIDRVSGIAVDFGFASIEDLDADSTVRESQVSASYSRLITEDWSAAIGLGQTLRDDDRASGSAVSRSVFVSLGRSFDTSF